MIKSQYKQDLHCSGYKEKTATQLHRRVLQDFAFQYISYFKTSLHLAHLKQYPKANRPEYIERSANLQRTLSAAVFFFLRNIVDIWGRFYGNEWKTGYIVSFLNEKS